MLSTAYELCGDTFVVLENYEAAIDSYEKMLKTMHRSNMKGQSTALFKLGDTSVHFLKFTSHFCNDFNYMTGL
jgi:predicted negative regulator of RcsB-dependent stress response